MKININHTCSDFNSYRANRVKALFNVESGCNWSHMAELPIDENDWQIGVVVGSSGSGKTSVGNAVWGGGRVHNLYEGWPIDIPIIDAIAPNSDFDTVTGALAAVGLGDVPSWLRPFNVLSNGEKFRAGLARVVVERPTEIVIDEFTSVIDRQIARVGAAAFAKSWRRGKGKIILLSCHYDILEWVQPDWVYDMSTARFSRDCLRCPKIEMDIYKVDGTLWKYFEPHHYLKLPLPIAGEYYIGVVNNEPVCHIAFSPFFQVKAYRAMRFVVLPEWQGVGIGTSFLNEMCRLYKLGIGRKGMKYHTYFNTSHPQLCHNLRKSPYWQQISAKLYGANKLKSIPTSKIIKSTLAGYGGHFRAIQGFKFMGGC